MRKIVFLMHVSLDGLVAGPNGEMDWIVYNQDVEKYSHDLHAVMDTAIYGRVTYEMMASYWRTVPANPDSTPADLAHANWLESATKIVVSRTLTSVDWDNTHIIHDNLLEEFTRLKHQAGKDMWLLGSATLAQSLMNLGLIDEYRLNINPVVLGSGKPLFDKDTPINLQLIDSQTLSGGVIASRYTPAK